MKKIILLLSILFTVLAGSYWLYDFKKNEAKKEYYKPLSPKDFEPETFISLLKEKYNQSSKLNSVVMTGEFSENWVKPNDVEYLISIIESKEKCCGYKNTFSSYISSEDAEVGGFAIIFLNSYISKTKINLGLNCNPKTDKEEVQKIETWYKTVQKPHSN